MESKREYRDAPGRDIKLPRAVYYRCLWTVRDMARLEQIEELLRIGAEQDAAGSFGSHTDFSGDDMSDGPVQLITDETAAHAAFDLGCIRRALLKIPQDYRENLLDNIINKTPYGDFAHPNTWKRWKLVFMYELARELRLI